MRGDSWFKSTAFLVAASVGLVCSGAASVRAQELDPSKFNQSYESAVAKARQECATLWADHAFDPLRDKINFREDKPPPAMLTNSTRIRPKEKPLADLAITTLGKCRTAWAPAYALLPPQVNAMIQGVERRQDSLIAELYVGKITFGEFNVGMNRITGELMRALSGIPETPQTASAPVALEKKSTAVSEAATLPKSRPTEVNPAPKTTVSREVRVALVIGDSNYSNLPRLANPENDARAIADVLKKIGFTTRLVLNASEQDLRREVRKFAGESGKADIALVFYAGHAAQVNGENYVLPVDMDIPQTNSDIQLTGLNVLDLVNSIRAKTKVVFLDACRDNPALYKNLVKARGGYPTGLAPAVASNLNPTNPGGGSFIAYATEAGSVAQDGEGKHSPFTQALLDNLSKPISIDDMFSLVTREVRLVTKGTQRPYKYASLENIVCLAGGCSAVTSPADTDVVKQAKHSETEDLQIALQMKNSEGLEAYLQKYPESTKRNEVLSEIAKLKRSEFDEWTLFEVGDHQYPQYIKLSSIQHLGDRSAALIRWVPNPSAQKIAPISQYPDTAYVEDFVVYDCKQAAQVLAEQRLVSSTGQTLYHYNWGDPRYLTFAAGLTLAPGSVGYTAQKIACHAEINTPAVSKKQLAAMNFDSLSSTVKGDGNLFYKVLSNNDDKNDKKLLFIFKFFEEREIPVGQDVTIGNVPRYQIEVEHTTLKCNERKLVSTTSEYYDAENRLVYLIALDPLSGTIPWVEIKDVASPLSQLHRIVCNIGETQK